MGREGRGKREKREKRDEREKERTGKRRRDLFQLKFLATPLPARLVLGWVTVGRRINHICV